MVEWKILRDVRDSVTTSSTGSASGEQREGCAVVRKLLKGNSMSRRGVRHSAAKEEID